MNDKTISVPLPEGFIKEMRSLPGIDSEALLRSLDLPPAIGVRFNSRKPSHTGLELSETVDWCPQGRWLSTRPRFTLMPELHAGAFYVQDPSSMIHREIVSRLADEPVAVVDFCAAPGGKTTAALDALPDGSVMIANEFEPSRVGALKENLTKWGYPGVAVTNADTKVFRSLKGFIDIAIVDAPCSGEGMMRKEAAARTQWSEGLVRQCAAIQWEIIGNAIEALKPGGYLIYSTCTFNLTENENMLIRMRDEMGMVPVDMNLPADWGIGASLADIPAIRFMPHITRGEGLFVGVMQKSGNLDSGLKRRHQKKAPRHDKIPIDGLIINPENYILENKGNTFQAIPIPLHILLSELPSRTKILSAGVEIGEMKGKDFIPSPALALSSALRHGEFPETELSRDEAIAFLRREPLLPSGETARGINLVCHGHLPLGWIKNIGSRANNLYPQAWKIRS